MNEWDVLKKAALEMGIALPEKSMERLTAFTERLLEVNQVMNLTAITNLNEIITKHYIDSLTPLQTGLFAPGARVIDVGCGAGFPGIVLKIAREDLILTLLDGQNKRIGFLKETGAMLGLDGVTYLHERAEAGGRKAELRERFTIAISRAVAPFGELCELCLPYVEVGGALIAMKGPDPAEEVKKGERAVKALGGQVEEIRPAPLWGTDILHSLVVVRKMEKTRKEYPRSYAKIAKKPL